MVKVMALLRTLVLIALVAWMTWALPLGVIFFAPAARERNIFEVADITKVAIVGWTAIGWIALETVFGWSKAWYLDRQKRKALERTAASAVAAASAASAAVKKAP